MKKNSMFLRLLAAVMVLLMMIPAACLAETAPDYTKLTEGAEVRIMSYNVLHPDWNDMIKITGRNENFLAIINRYMPDVVGLQEAGAKWHKFWKPHLIDTGIYSTACRKSNAEGFTYNTSAILYKMDTLKLLDEYVLDLDKNSATRVLSVAVFEYIADGSRFVVCNTHTAPSNAPEEYNRHFGDLMKMIPAEMEKYAGLPFILTGDYNTDEEFEMFTTFMNAVNVNTAKYEADVVVREHATYKGWKDEELNPDRLYVVDHIFVNEMTDVKLYNVVIDQEAQDASDHLPVYADIELK